MPGIKHKGPDGLSRQRRGEDNSEDEEKLEEEAERWVDKVLRSSVWVAGLEMAGEEGKGMDGVVLAVGWRKGMTRMSFFKVGVREED